MERFFDKYLVLCAEERIASQGCNQHRNRAVLNHNHHYLNHFEPALTRILRVLSANVMPNVILLVGILFYAKATPSILFRGAFVEYSPTKVSKITGTFGLFRALGQ